MTISPSSNHRLATALLGVVCLVLSFASNSASAINVGGHEIGASISAESGVKPEYHLESGSYLETGLALSYKSKLPVKFSLKQTLTTVDTADAREKAGIRPDDTLGSVSLKDPIEIKPIKATLAASFGGVVYAGSDLSTYRTNQARLGPSLSLIFIRGKWTTGLSSSYGYYINKETRRPDGNANNVYRYVNGIGTTYSLPLNLKISADYLSYHFVNSDDASSFAYVAAAAISRAQTEKLNLSLGLLTKDLEVKGGRKSGVYVYKEDLSQVYFGANYSL